MSKEILKNSGEKNGGASGLEVLTNEAGKFNPEKAAELRREAEKTKNTEHLVALKEDQKEISPYDEYRDLVKELAADLPDDNGKGVNYGNETRVDAILGNEIAWRKNGEDLKEKIAENDTKKTALQKAYDEKGFLGKLFGKRKFNREMSSIDDNLFTLRNKVRTADSTIATNLAKAYGDEYGDADRNNEKRNQQFFGFDDPERAKKVERAIELRRSFEDSKEWRKEKNTPGKMIRDLTIERQKKQ